MTNKSPAAGLGNSRTVKKIAELAKSNRITATIGDFITRPESIMNTITSRYPIGRNVFEYEWDLLIILDACRVDALRTVSAEFNFITDVESILSVGSASQEWVQKTFVKKHEDEISNTVYITANPWAKRVLSEEKYLNNGYPNWSTLPIESLERVEHVWEMREQLGKRAHPEGTSAPEFVTDNAIELGRQNDYDRMIVHYVPPHHPYVANAVEGRPLDSYEKHPFQYMRNKKSRKKPWEAYLDELRWGLKWVEILLSNIDASTTIITSDHGEAFGEFGRYMHDPGLILPTVKNVPWVETTAVDKAARTPETDNIHRISKTDPNTEEQLRAMGYLS